MPEYAYRASTEEACDVCRDGFTVRQGIRDERLTTCPECGAPVRRVMQPFSYSTGFGNKPPSLKTMKDHGFQVLRNEGEGKYRKL